MAGTFFAGSIADVGVYDTALAEYDVKLLLGKVTPGDAVWLDDDLPPGVAPVTAADDSTAEPWTWTTANPTPFAGARCHQSPTRAGTHQHYFTPLPDGWPVDPGDRLYSYVYLDPANLPTQIMLQWNVAGASGWDHRAYWGAPDDGPSPRFLPFGKPGTGRRYMGPLPPAGRWMRLEVPAATVGLEQQAVSIIAFTLYDGQAWWDLAGKTSAHDALAAAGYPATAYQAVLTALGTSLDELRLARGAPSSTRQALAARLGITLSPTRPDQLDALLLPLDAVGEADLERLFGLPRLGTDPPSVPVVAQLTVWQQQTLRTQWALQDHATTAATDLTPPHHRPRPAVPSRFDHPGCRSAGLRPVHPAHRLGGRADPAAADPAAGCGQRGRRPGGAARRRAAGL